MNKVHGYCRTPTYNSWMMMLRRCRDPKRSNYKYYGGRGIAVCDRWLHFGNFLVDMGERPAGTTLDRIDTNGDYTPENCKWSNATTQSRNRRKFVPWQTLKTHCPQGHPYEGNNLQIHSKNKYRRCAMCHRLQERARRISMRERYGIGPQITPIQ